MHIFLIRRGETIFNANRTVQFGNNAVTTIGSDTVLALGSTAHTEHATYPNHPPGLRLRFVSISSKYVRAFGPDGHLQVTS